MKTSGDDRFRPDRGGSDDIRRRDACDRRRGRSSSGAVREQLERGARVGYETPKPGDPRLRVERDAVIADRRTAMAGARREAERRGYDTPHAGDADPRRGIATPGGCLPDSVVDDALAKCRVCVIAIGRDDGDGEWQRPGRPKSGIRARRGARAAPDTRGRPQSASAGTDGIDGPTDAAGGVVTSLTAAQALEAGVDLSGALASNDAYAALGALGALLRWGPTLTNVGDVHVLLTMRA